MPAFSTMHKNGSVTRHFETTVRMSTYILCWVISDFKSIETISKYNTTIRAWAPQQNLQDTHFGLITTSRLLTFYEDFFQIPYPLVKLDMVAVPSFGPGAMENWGLITYRSSRLFYSPSTTTEDEKQTIFSIIAHELVHQWFGNLATMKFWTDAWLKEGFANYIGTYGGEKLEPGMEFMTQSLSKLMLPALSLDSYFTSNPISAQATTPDEIREIFNVITYQKGHCMVQMLHSYLGYGFQKGLQRYLTTYSYKNADQDDLWRELSLSSGKDVKSVMDTWTLQMGYPVITAERINTSHVTIHQERFSLDPIGTVPPPSPFNYQWQVPISYKTFDDLKILTTRLLTTKSDTIEIMKKGIFNPNHEIFSRFNYKGSMLNDIKETLLSNHSLLTIRDKVGLISDQFSMAAANLSSLEHALDMTKYLKNEIDYYPWEITLDELLTINSLTEDLKTKANLKMYIKYLTSDLINQLSWNKITSVNKGLLQSKLLKTGCAIDNYDVINQAKQFYSEWVKSNGTSMPIEANLYPIVRDCTLSQSGTEEWNFAFKRYTEENGSEKASMLNSLASTRDGELIQRLLNYTNNSTIINSQEAPYLIANIARRSNIGRQLAWQHIKKHWSSIFNKYNNELFLFGNMLSTVLSAFSTDTDLQDIEQFFAKQTDLGSGTKAIEQSKYKIKSNLMWNKVNSDDLKSWFNKNSFFGIHFVI